MGYHKHPERTFSINVFDLKNLRSYSLRVDRREDTLFLNGSPILFLRLHKDKTVEVHTASMNTMEEGYLFNGSEIWRMLHDDEEPDQEYTGYLEAQLLGIKLLANHQNFEWTQQQTTGRDIGEEEAEP
ncbi:MAG: hypothetical protein H0V70_23995 [Ktedonobacteraceae bacterium]|nr:hypothetical protein [Ktedonobacteraceae bacterium]